MAKVLIEMTSGVLADHLSRTMRPVTYFAFPDGVPPPLGIWGPTDPRPTPPIAFPPGWVGGVPPGTPPGIWGPTDPRPNPPIAFPPGWVGGVPPWQPPLPPDFQPPAAGEPPVPLPPPAGSGGWPTQPIAMPAYQIYNYPGYGPIVVSPPAVVPPNGGGTIPA